METSFECVIVIVIMAVLCNFDIFAASSESTAWVLLWKTRSRPIGVRVCPASPFDFSVPHLIRVTGQRLCSVRKIRDVNPS